MGNARDHSKASHDQTSIKTSVEDHCKNHRFFRNYNLVQATVATVFGLDSAPLAALVVAGSLTLAASSHSDYKQCKANFRRK